MAKKTIRDIDLSGKRLLIRADFNVPVREDGSIANDRRIRVVLPMIRLCLENHASLLLMVHLGGPSREFDEKLRMRRVVFRLQKLLSETPVEVAGSDWEQKADKLEPGQVLLLENLRFDRGEKGSDERFAGRLREVGEICVHDAFAACHRKYASMCAVPKLFPAGIRVIDLLVKMGLAGLDNLLQSPQQPMIAIRGDVGDFARKVRRPEWIESRISRIVERQPDVLIATGDHSTPSRLRNHSWPSVPVLLSANSCRHDRVERFGERETACGGLGQVETKSPTLRGIGSRRQTAETGSLN